MKTLILTAALSFLTVAAANAAPEAKPCWTNVQTEVHAKLVRDGVLESSIASIDGAISAVDVQNSEIHYAVRVRHRHAFGYSAYTAIVNAPSCRVTEIRFEMDYE